MLFFLSKSPNLIFLFHPPSTSPSRKVHQPSPLPKSDSLAPGLFFRHKKRGLGIPTSGFVMLKSMAHTMVSPWKLHMRSITLHMMMIGDRKIIYQVFGSWSCIPKKKHLWLAEAFACFGSAPSHWNPPLGKGSYDTWKDSPRLSLPPNRKQQPKFTIERR